MNRMIFFKLYSKVHLGFALIFGLTFIVLLFLVKEYAYLFVISFFCLFLGRFFLFKNYFEWDYKGCIIKLNNYFKVGKKINFSNVEYFTHSNNKLKFYTTENKILTFNLSNINKKDINKMSQILLEYISDEKSFNQHKIKI